MSTLEQDIAAIDARIKAHSELVIAACELTSHHKDEIRSLYAERAQMVAQRSPAAVRAMEVERGLV